MPQSMSSARKAFPALIVLTTLCLAVFGTGSWLSHARRGKQEINPPVANQTNAIEVVGVKVLDGSLQLSIRNSGSKNITWYKLLIGDMGLEAEFTYASQPVIAPGEVYTEQFPTNTGLATKGVSVLSVLFEDGTSEGDQQLVKKIKERRQGEKAQLTRFLNLLGTILDSPKEEHARGLNDLEARIMNFPEDQEERLTEHVRLGLRGGKSQALKFIRELQDEQAGRGGEPPREALTRLKRRCEEVIGRL